MDMELSIDYQLAQKVNERFFMRKLQNEQALQQLAHFRREFNEIHPTLVNLDGIPGQSRILLLRDIIQAVGDYGIERKLTQSKVIVHYIIGGVPIEYQHIPASSGAPGNVYCPEMGDYQGAIRNMMHEITTSAGYVLFGKLKMVLSVNLIYCCNEILLF
jgi:hypothetical protein